MPHLPTSASVPGPTLSPSLHADPVTARRGVPRGGTAVSELRRTSGSGGSRRTSSAHGSSGYAARPAEADAGTWAGNHQLGGGGGGGGGNPRYATPIEHVQAGVRELRSSAAATTEGMHTARQIDEVQFKMSCGVRPSSTAPTKRVALVVGIDSYRHLGQREDSVSDAQKIKEVLLQLGYNVTTLFNADATKNGVLSAMRRLAPPPHVNPVAASSPTAFVLFLSTLCFRAEASAPTGAGGATLAACYDSSAEQGEAGFLDVSTVLDGAGGYLRVAMCDPSYATTLQRVAMMNMLKGVDASVSEGDPPAPSSATHPPAPALAQAAPAPASSGVAAASARGVSGAALPSVGVELCDFANRGVRGVKVVGARPGGPAERAGLQAGDVILALRGRAVSYRSDFRNVLSSFSGGESVDLTVAPHGGGPVSTVVVQLE